MNKHILSFEQLEGFEARSTLASSTKEKKKLEIISNLEEGDLTSHFKVSKDNIVEYFGISLQRAIDIYNTR